MSNMTMIVLFVAQLLAFILIRCVSTLGVEGWNTVKYIPRSYSHISVPNILRCEKLCEHQEKCSATTFDNRERMCYMHDSYVESPNTDNNTRGRYLFKKYQDETTNSNSVSTCDRNTQFAVPSIQRGNGACYDMKGVIGQICTTANECITPASECRSEGVCGCQAGYSYKPGTDTCEAACSQYGNTFQVFEYHRIKEFNEEVYTGKSPDDCAQRCINASFMCVTFDLHISDNKCFLQAVDATDQPTYYLSGTGFHHYQRNCA